MLTWGEWMKVLGDMYRYGVADGKRVANSELLEQVSGPEQVHLERSLRHGVQDAMAVLSVDILWHDYPVQFNRISTGLGSGT